MAAHEHESKEAPLSIQEVNEVSVNLATGEIVIVDTGKRFFAEPVPDFLREIVDAGGLCTISKKRD